MSFYGLFQLMQIPFCFVFLVAEMLETQAMVEIYFGSTLEYSVPGHNLSNSVTETIRQSLSSWRVGLNGLGLIAGRKTFNRLYDEMIDAFEAASFREKPRLLQMSGLTTLCIFSNSQRVSPYMQNGSYSVVNLNAVRI